MTQAVVGILKSTIEKAGDGTFVMSSGSPDRIADTIEISAYTPYLGKRLIALWQHKNDQPVGAWEDLRSQGKKLIGDLKLASTQLGQMIRQLLLEDVPLGASIGFRGKGEPNKQGGYHFTEIELLECSVVSVPMHPAAMRIGKSFDLSHLVGASSVPDEISAMSGRLDRSKSAIARANKLLGRA